MSQRHSLHIAVDDRPRYSAIIIIPYRWIGRATESEQPWEKYMVVAVPEQDSPSNVPPRTGKSAGYRHCEPLAETDTVPIAFGRDPTIHSRVAELLPK